ncbi:PleD family two-component system response regulator [Pedobacter jeongneungensis]|uniref:response regulator n=1 Tax=Pedobacter jeongneungensis TaxID=947309 RepID=UPI000469EC8A|nr:response regulator [Pedobacter jeongneungensis]
MGAKKILICDDDRGIIDVLEMVLEETGHRVITETNSLNARAIIDSEKPDLIILDLWMPVLSGDQILQMIRRTPETQDIPVIIISASRDGAQIATEAGANKFIAKPFDIYDMVDSVEALLA